MRSSSLGRLSRSDIAVGVQDDEKERSKIMGGQEISTHFIPLVTHSVWRCSGVTQDAS